MKKKKLILKLVYFGFDTRQGGIKLKNGGTIITIKKQTLEKTIKITGFSECNFPLDMKY